MKDKIYLVGLELFIEELRVAEDYRFMHIMRQPNEFIYSREAYITIVERVCSLWGSGKTYDDFCITFGNYIKEIPEDPTVLRDMLQAKLSVGEDDLIFEAQSGLLFISTHFDSTGNARVWMVSIYLELLAVQNILNFCRVTSLLMRTHNENGVYQVGPHLNWRTESVPTIDVWLDHYLPILAQYEKKGRSYLDIHEVTVVLVLGKTSTICTRSNQPCKLQWT